MELSAGPRKNVVLAKTSIWHRQARLQSTARHLTTIPSPELKAQLVARISREIGPKATPPARPKPKSKNEIGHSAEGRLESGAHRTGSSKSVDDTCDSAKASCCAESGPDIRCRPARTAVNAPQLRRRQLLFEGEQPTRRMNILGAVGPLLPRYCRQGNRGLPRSWRALKGWRKLCPGLSRTPEPLGIWCAMTNALARDGHQCMRAFSNAECEHLSATRPVDAIARKVHRESARIVGNWSLLVDPEEEGMS